MSSSNLVQINYMKEAEYGVRPDQPYSGVTMETARFTSEALSGTPLVTESQGLRTDRMSPGQVVTGLEVGGTIDWELARDIFFDDFLEAAMMNSWVPEETQNDTITLVPDGTDNQKAVLTLGTDFPNIAVGTLVELNAAAGLVAVKVISVDTPNTVFTVATTRGQEALSETLDVSIPAYVDIGASKASFLIGKAYTDVVRDATTDQYSQTYLGELVSGFSVNATYGEIVTGSFTMMANGYEQESGQAFYQLVEADGGTVNPAGTSQPLNASIDMPIMTVDGEATTYCTESMTIELDNGMTPQNCLGRDAPLDYNLGTAAISITATIYNSATSYDALMAEKLSQAPVSMSMTMVNADGGYTFDLRAVQLSFPDPAATGRDEQVMIDAAGVARVGLNGESALRIYRH